MSPDSDRTLAHDRLADRFDEVMNRYDLERRLQVLVDGFLSDVALQGRLALDAGCGTGPFSRALHERNAHVVALDLGPRLVSRVNKRYGICAVTGTLLALPFASETFDIVLSSEAIEHTPDPLAATLELCRVVKPGGHLVLSTPNRLWQGPVRWASSSASNTRIRETLQIDQTQRRSTPFARPLGRSAWSTDRQAANGR
jgi:2-polyprenyl-3-methyl-5-hydroxy-6-metoxy-1,4-benzoquinol methylase